MRLSTSAIQAASISGRCACLLRLQLPSANRRVIGGFAIKFDLQKIDEVAAFLDRELGCGFHKVFDALVHG